MPAGCRIYGIIIKKGGHGYIVISPFKEKLKKYAEKERKKGFEVDSFYKGFKMMRIDDENAPLRDFE